MKKALFVAAGAAFAIFSHSSNVSAQNYLGEYQQIQAQAQDCQIRTNEVNARRAAAAMNGYIIPNPPCMSYMPQWISRMAFLEAQLYHQANPGDRDANTCSVSGLCDPRRRDRY
jgi:hypothetical protein